MQGDAGAVTLRVEADLEDVEDPVINQIRALHNIVQPLKVCPSLKFFQTFIIKVTEDNGVV